MVDDSIKQGVQQVAQEIYDKHGKLTPSLLVEAARPEDSPAHGGFEWDDSKAGEQYRLWQGRYWSRRVEIRAEPSAEPERPISVPVVVLADDAPDKGREGEYQLPSVLIQRPDEFARALQQAQAKFTAARRALDELYTAAERTERADQAAIIAQIAKATELWASALSAMH